MRLAPVSGNPLAAEDMEFATAVARLKDLLVSIRWPLEIEWLESEHVLHFPLRATIVFRPQSRGEGERQARRVFRDRYGIAPAVMFYACGHDNTRTYAFVEAIEELGQGEEMFVSDGLKVASQANATKTHVTSSAFWWWLHRRSYRNWERRIARSLAGG